MADNKPKVALITGIEEMREIIFAVCKIALGVQSKLFLEDLSTQQNIIDGQKMTVRELVQLIFAGLGIEIAFSGKGESEKGVIIDIDEDRLEELGIEKDLIKFGQTVVKIDPNYYRTTEVELLIGDARKAQEKLNSKPKYDLEMLIADTVASDFKLLKKEIYLRNEGFGPSNSFG